jgi:hypothetical protein
VAIGLGVLGLVLVWASGTDPRLIDEEQEQLRSLGCLPAGRAARWRSCPNVQVGMWLGSEAPPRRLVARLSAAAPTSSAPAQPVLPGAVEEDEVYLDGWIAGYGRPGNHLDVSQGVGMSRIPARFNTPPELTPFLLGAAG